jgi:putative transposase
VCRWLYNHLLAARRDAWEQRQVSLRLYDPQAMLPALKVERPVLAGVQSQVRQNGAVRLDLAFQAFFRRCKAGEEPGYPRFSGQGRYERLTFPHVPVGCRLEAADQRVRLATVGRVKVIVHRPLEGTPQTATIGRSRTDTWSVSCSCACAEPAAVPPTAQAVGSAVGLTTCATLRSGRQIANPRFLRTEDRARANAHRRLSQAEQGTPDRAERRTVVARVHERLAWRRGDFAHQHRRRLVNAFDLSAVEDVSLNRMRQTQCLAKSRARAAWTPFAAALSHTVAWAGRRSVAVHPADTSQDCSLCGHRQPLSLADRTYVCPCCGLLRDRDLNAARNSVRLGRQSLASAAKLPQSCGRVVTCHAARWRPHPRANS